MRCVLGRPSHHYAGTLFICPAPVVGVVRLLYVTTDLVIGLRSPLDDTKLPLQYVR